MDCLDGFEYRPSGIFGYVQVVRSETIYVVEGDLGRVSMCIVKRVQIRLKEEDQQETQRKRLKRGTLVGFDEVEGSIHFSDLFPLPRRRY